MLSSLLSEVQRRAADAGLNLFGLVDADRFDAAQTKERRVRTLAPNCGTVLVIGSGGRRLWQQFARASESAGCHAACNVDRYALDVVRTVDGILDRARIGARTVPAGCSTRLPFAQLAEAAGLGTVSPVTGLLLHPEYGPWVRIRAVVLADGRPFGPIADASISSHFHPCCGCSRPCVAACPVGVHDGGGSPDLQRCAEHRDEGNCETYCQSRSACPIGSEHRDAAGEYAHGHSHPLRAMRRWFGLGVWRWVPTSWRGRP